MIAEFLKTWYYVHDLSRNFTETFPSLFVVFPHFFTTLDSCSRLGQASYTSSALLIYSFSLNQRTWNCIWSKIKAKYSRTRTRFCWKIGIWEMGSCCKGKRSSTGFYKLLPLSRCLCSLAWYHFWSTCFCFHEREVHNFVVTCIEFPTFFVPHSLLCLLWH